MLSYTIGLFGDSGVGKTTFIERIRTGEFVKTHHPTESAVKYTLKFNTTQGLISFNLIENPTVEMVDKLDITFLMFDASSLETFNHLSKFYQDFHNIKPDLPVIQIGTKIDLPRKVSNKMILKTISRCNHYFDVSSKSGYNIEKPFLYSLRLLLKSKTIDFVN